jgi:hypothetical protein
MANGHSVIEELREMAADENSAIPMKAYNRLMLSAIVELYDAVKPVKALNVKMIYVFMVGSGIIGVLGWLVALHVKT